MLIGFLKTFVEIFSFKSPIQKGLALKKKIEKNYPNKLVHLCILRAHCGAVSYGICFRLSEYDSVFTVDGFQYCGENGFIKRFGDQFGFMIDSYEKVSDEKDNEE